MSSTNMGQRFDAPLDVWSGHSRRRACQGGQQDGHRRNRASARGAGPADPRAETRTGWNRAAGAQALVSRQHQPNTGNGPAPGLRGDGITETSQPALPRAPWQSRRLWRLSGGQVGDRPWAMCDATRGQCWVCPPHEAGRCGGREGRFTELLWKMGSAR